MVMLFGKLKIYLAFPIFICYICEIKFTDMAYVYQHVRLDTNEIFYIGIGSDEEGKYERAKARSKTSRTSNWHDIIKTTKYRVDILYDNLAVGDAKIMEINLINFYGRRDLGLGTLCNLTDGGDGGSGSKRTEETKRLMSEKASLRTHSEETRKKIGLAVLGRKDSEETRRKKSLTWKGRNHSEESKIKISVTKTGKRNITRSCRLVLNIETGIYYDSILEAAESCYIDQRRLYEQVTGRKGTKLKKNKSSFILV